MGNKKELFACCLGMVGGKPQLKTREDGRTIDVEQRLFHVGGIPRWLLPLVLEDFTSLRTSSLPRARYHRFPCRGWLINRGIMRDIYPPSYTTNLFWYYIVPGTDPFGISKRTWL